MGWYTYLSANDFILGISGGGVFGREGFGGPIGFLALPITDGNLRPNFKPLVVEVDSVDDGVFSSVFSLAPPSGLNPGGKNEATDSVSMLSNKLDMSSLKSELDDSVLGLVSSFSSFGGLNPGGKNALMSDSNSSFGTAYGIK